MAEGTGKTFELSLVTPDGAAYEGEAEMLIVPGADGEIGVLARHAPLVAMLKAGELRRGAGILQGAAGSGHRPRRRCSAGRGHRRRGSQARDRGGPGAPRARGGGRRGPRPLEGRAAAPPRGEQGRSRGPRLAAHPHVNASLGGGGGGGLAR